jgi:hypothetical protein
MVKFNYSLDTDPTLYTKLIPLTSDEITLYKSKFKDISDNYSRIPYKIYDDMIGIETQFNIDYKLSPNQIKYIEDIHEKYCSC